MNVTSAVRQAVERTSWFKKRQRYRVLYWREISPLAVPILLENACVLLMGVLSTFLVSWLGKEAMAGVGLADSFNMVIMSFFAAIDLGTTVVVAFSLGKRDRRRARAAARQSLAIMTLFSILLAGVIHAFGQEIIDFVVGDATAQVKDLALTYLELTALSYPAAAIALIGSGALRGAKHHQNPAADQRRDEYPQYLNQQRAHLRHLLLAGAGVCRRRAWADHCPLYWRDSHDLGADGGPQSGAAAVAEGLLQTL